MENTSELNLHTEKPAKPISVLVIDNYDSFVYNLVHYLEELDCLVTVRRNNEISLEEVGKFDKILLSPGPGIPAEAGLLNEIVKEYAPTKSILGVCLGQQAIGEVFGGKLLNLDSVFHGVAHKIKLCVEDEGLYNGLEKEFEVGRYHSWVVERNLPSCLEATSYDEQGQVMSLRHREFDVRGVQFHPESVLTPDGKKMIKNWVNGTPPVPSKPSEEKEKIENLLK
ncbi:aminodeoxychorismate/anthranilate synthase component II [Antarcticibacterium flavum]|uniref:Aminodeoxychorismate/anthranilate synthase component II n=1 Tax=Antarcticibacterium flavum TaxID=2058175 RepID=A0A5B7X4R0_9FLAO|nr:MULTISPECIES: aminodeoxychorismate/anthranilate synthase component II [Antarcticibacterium]MCM4159981.1 aminodeoxychorismate/anthranilate synthase component II [Antarcticibacterium sp. W02-3]QCY70426.1 aminodeoxychorismate/anthranilate synthase component II [Antarcticibacterium flavum]